VTIHFPLPAGILITDRNRADLDWKNGSFTWRYRNKLTLERTLSIRSYHLIPYVAAEPFYESQYKKWNTTDLYAGCSLWETRPIQSLFSVRERYGQKNQTGSSIMSGWLSTFTFPWKTSSHQLKQRPAYASNQAFLKEGSGLVDEYQGLLSCLGKEESAPHGPGLLPNASLDV
jgi:hypothetical protein